MANEIDVEDLRHDLRSALARAEHGERLTITDRGRPVAGLVPFDSTSVDTSTENPRFAPLVMDTGDISLTEVLIEIREETTSP